MTITVNLPPQAKGRPKFTRSGHAYTPNKTKTYEDAVRLLASSRIKSPLTGALKVDISFYLPIPKSWSSVRKRASMGNQIRPTTRPDIDNLCKAILDALNGIAYVDDRQIVELNCYKYYGEPRTVIHLEEI